MLRLRMREWERITVAEEPALAGSSFGDNSKARAVAEELAKAGILEVVELRSGLSIESTSYVGRVQLGGLQITVQPKLKLNVLLTLFRYAYKLRDLHLLTETDLDAEPDAFHDILIEQLIAEVSELISRGLHRRYRQVAEDLAVPKGRIDLQSIARRGGVVGPAIAVVHYPRLENNLINQVLLAGLHLAVPMTTDLLMRSRLRRLAGVLELSISRIPLDLATFRRLGRESNRLTSHYEPSVTLIQLLVRSSGITLEATAERITLPGFLFDMNNFFERLLTRFLNENLPEFTVHDQYRLTGMMSYVPEHNPKRRQAPTPRPDFVITRGKKPIAILDAKYRDLWEKPLPRDMLYQLAIYALSQGWNGQSVILYPSVDNAPQLQVIDIRDALTDSNKAHVLMLPVNLVELSSLLQDNSFVGRRKRAEFARKLVIDGVPAAM